MSPMAPTPPFVASPASALVPRGHAFPAPNGDDWSPAEGAWMSMKSTCNPPGRIPAGYCHKLCQLSYYGPNTVLVTLLSHAAVTVRSMQTDKTKPAYYAMFPSEKSMVNPYSRDPSQVQVYHYYDCGPRWMVITVIGNLVLMWEGNNRSTLSTTAMLKKVADFVAHLTRHHGEYFGSLDTDDFHIHVHTPVADVLALLVPAFEKFVRMFHGIRGFTLDTKLCAKEIKESQVDRQGTPKLANPCLLLLLPKSCMSPTDTRNVDASYQHPATCEIHMVEIKELPSSPS